MRDSLVLCLRYALIYFFNLKFVDAVDKSFSTLKSKAWFQAVRQAILLRGHMPAI